MSERSKILIVDDDEVVRHSYQRSLQAANSNVEIEAAFNGEDALEVLERKSFDVVLLDLRMPGMDGMSVLKAIKRDWPKSGVVVITGYPTLESAKEAMRLGAYDYLAKPVSPAEIISAANTAITQKRWALYQDLAGPGGNSNSTINPKEDANKLAS
jgi:DNA-binding NtrC family response regulator